MDKRPKKSLVKSLHDRSRRTKNSSTININVRDAQYLPNDDIDDLTNRIERLENECIRYNKVLTMYIDRIEDLEKTVTILKCKAISSETIISESQQKHTKISRWIRFTDLFKQRPTLNSLKERNIYKNEPCFDTDIESVIKHERYQTVPKIVIECIALIEAKIKITPVEGLYRVPGDHVEIQKIRFNIDANNYDCLNYVKDVHTIVGVLKLFLREIKSPLIKSSEIKAFIGSPTDWSLSTIQYKIDVLQKLMKSLPEINRDTLCCFLKHLNRICHMSLQYINARSLSISIGPTIFHVHVNHKNDIQATLKENEILNNCLEFMIEYCVRIFDFDFQTTAYQNL